MFGRPAPRIEFLCAPENLGVIAEPVPARDALPDWFRRLPAVDKERLSVTDNALTVKRCMPFLDAMNAGWVLPLAATIRIEIADGGQTVNSGWDFDRTMVSQHHPYQVAGHPMQPRPPNKFHNHWTIRTPKGWSCLFIPPMNQPNGVVEIAAGIVDTDEYSALINFPFFATAPDGFYTLAVLARRGHPLLHTHVTLKDVHQARWVLPRAGSPARQLLDNCFAAAGLTAPWPVVESADLAVIRGLLVRSDMLAAVSAHQLAYEIASGELQRLPLALPGTARAIGLMQRSGCLQSPAAVALMACIRQVITEQA
mgnify:CR=1 FL=1